MLATVLGLGAVAALIWIVLAAAFSCRLRDRDDHRFDWFD